MSHHYNPSVYYKNLPDLQITKKEEFKKYNASVFQGLSIAELSIFVLFSMWDKLADHYVDHSGGKLSRDEIKSMLKIRAQRKQMTYEEYEKFLQKPTPENLEILSAINTKNNKKYVADINNENNENEYKEKSTSDENNNEINNNRSLSTETDVIRSIKKLIINVLDENDSDTSTESLLSVRDKNEKNK